MLSSLTPWTSIDKLSLSAVVVAVGAPFTSSLLADEVVVVVVVFLSRIKQDKISGQEANKCALNIHHCSITYLTSFIFIFPAEPAPAAGLVPVTEPDTLRGLPTSVRPDDCHVPFYVEVVKPEPTTTPPLADTFTVDDWPPILGILLPIMGCKFGRNGYFFGRNVSARSNISKICVPESIDCLA